MRVRPFFWILLAASCIGALVFAATWRAHAPAVMQVHVAQHPTASGGYTAVALHLMDEQGLPIEAAQVFSQANMTNMEMITKQSSTRYLGKGDYITQLRLYMAGPWLITIQVYAEGFDMPRQTLLVDVR
jgi:YtkA-like